VASVLEIDSRSFGKGFSERSFKVRHSLLSHPLLTIDSIARLADELPSESVWRRSGDRAVGVASAGEDPDTGPPSETIKGIEENNRWVMLRFIEQVPEYAALVNLCLDDVEPFLAGREGGMAQRNGYLFLSSPSAVTPVHFDSEHNLLLQIRGTKEVSVCEFSDDRQQQMAVERHWDRAQPDFPAMTAEAQTYNLDPGDGVYMAPYLPHWVKNGPEVSISLSIPFYTEFALRAEHVNKVNARLRRLHMRPRPPGTSQSVDKAKSALFITGEKVRESTKVLHR
jgi:JmjC domain